MRPGGIDTCIRDLLAYRGDRHIVRVGLDRSGVYPHYGAWYDVDDYKFMPVARAPSDSHVPDSARLLAGLLRYRKRLPEPGYLQVHRVDVAAAASIVLGGRGLVTFVHGDGEGGLGEASDSRWRHLPGGYRIAEWRAVSQSHRVAVFSERGAKRIGLKGHSRVAAYPTWFDGKVFSLGAPTIARRAAIQVAWVGRLENPKDPLLALRTIEFLASEGHDVHLWLIGSGSLEGAMKDTVATWGLSGRVSLTGHQSREGVAEYLRAADITLSTSVFEGFPRVLVESLAVGTPIVAPRWIVPELLQGRVGVHAASQRTMAELGEGIVVAAAWDQGESLSTGVADLAAEQIIPRLLDWAAVDS